MVNGKAKITSAEWANIVVSYQRGEKTLQELGDEYGVTKQAIRQGLKRRGVTNKSRLTENIVNEEDEARRERDEQVAAAKKRVENYAKYNDVITQMIMKRMVEGDRDNNVRSYDADVRVLNNASKAVQRCRRENWEILNVEQLLEGEDSLPDLNVGEYTPEELEQIRQANEENYLESQDGDDEDFELPDFDEDQADADGEEDERA